MYLDKPLHRILQAVNLELKALQRQGDTQVGIKTKDNTDGDSGVLVAGDGNTTIFTDFTTSGARDQHIPKKSSIIRCATDSEGTMITLDQHEDDMM